MTSFVLTLSQRQRVERAAEYLPTIIRLLLIAAIGVELMTLVSWLPDTLGRWWSPDMAGMGDFAKFYNSSKNSTSVGLYSPGLAFLLRPLSLLSLATAYQVYFVINAGALLGVAYLAQRSVRSPEARVAVFLAVIALPQAHWALRTGHFVPVLALLALGGFLLVERRPLLAGIFFGLLILKPQYLPIPILYLLWTRNGPALRGAFGSLIFMSVAGMAIIGPSGFFEQLQKFLHISVDQSHLYVPVQQAWQYSWQGFLISAGIEPNPLVTIDLIILSLGATMLVWVTRTADVAKVAAVLGMLLVAPYSSFYNWSMIAVAGVLLLRSDLRPKALVPILLVLGVIAAAATQKATPYPSLDVLGPGGTYGLYWLQPFALASVFLLAIAGKRRSQKTAAEPPMDQKPTVEVPVPKRQQRSGRFAQPVPRLAMGAAAAVFALSAGYVVSAYVSQNSPFEADLFTRQTVLRALPEDFPLPEDAKVSDAGRGTLLPYRVEWKSEQPLSEVAGLFGQRLSDGAWQIVLAEDGDSEGSILLRTVRIDLGGLMDVFAEVQVSETDGGSVFSLEFSPIPTTKVRGFDEWFEDRQEEIDSDTH